ncbi:hypothetical protein RIR_jg659.t1 [Rhizophagus irregularis DAOM 181602=DAOM 197198]|uniref:Uncharacterized protein n=1 Tax=Rhizophagus irregularis (strain DAOM 181602 / DAOM 197198 / MUCL 43194) TaxID=747089 RepID=U9U564_RHIID|nr:hypothetical protein RIR_jg659.t1 [Rhizophagus irregularis DAOM 181602=DAOM 197198]
MKREGLKKDNLARQEVESMWNISELSSGSKGAVCAVVSAVVAGAVVMIVAIAVAAIVAVAVVVAVVAVMVAILVVVAVAVVVVVTFAVIVARALCDPVSLSLLFKIDEFLLLFLINQDSP